MSSASVSIARKPSPLKTAPLCRRAPRGYCLHRLSKCPPQNKAIPDGVRYGTWPIPYMCVYIYIGCLVFVCVACWRWRPPQKKSREWRIESYVWRDVTMFAPSTFHKRFPIQH